MGCDLREVSKVVKVTETEKRMVNDNCCWEGEMETLFSLNTRYISSKYLTFNSVLIMNNTAPYT